MIVCKLNDAESRCAQGCQPRRRMKRDVEEEKSSRMYSLAQGPLVIQKSPPPVEVHRRHRRSVPDETLNDDEGEYLFFISSVVASVSAHFVCVTLLLIVMLLKASHQN